MRLKLERVRLIGILSAEAVGVLQAVELAVLVVAPAALAGFAAGPAASDTPGR